VELDPEKLLERIAEARNALLDRIEDSFSPPSDSDEYALRNALETLATMQKLAESDIGKQKKTVQTHLADYARNHDRESSE
jgi:hypothetical protein